MTEDQLRWLVKVARSRDLLLPFSALHSLAKKLSTAQQQENLRRKVAPLYEKARISGWSDTDRVTYWATLCQDLSIHDPLFITEWALRFQIEPEIFRRMIDAEFPDD